MKKIICVGIDRSKLLNSSVVVVQEVEDTFKFTKEWLVNHILQNESTLSQQEVEEMISDASYWHIADDQITEDGEEMGQIWSLV